MTAPADPIAVLLARIEVKLDNSLAEQARHTTTLDRHDVRISKLENRTSILETRDESDNAHQGRMLSTKVVGWTGGGTVAAIIGAIAAWRTGGGG